nr:uncharacterized protein LOC128697346 [Cherax quadricarinatus]XP_053644942.1 uncharacterized protein LOC128697346 [Cherax quadricarinatus]
MCDNLTHVSTDNQLPTTSTKDSPLLSSEDDLVCHGSDDPRPQEPPQDTLQEHLGSECSGDVPVCVDDDPATCVITHSSLSLEHLPHLEHLVVLQPLSCFPTPAAQVAETPEGTSPCTLPGGQLDAPVPRADMTYSTESRQLAVVTSTPISHFTHIRCRDTKKKCKSVYKHVPHKEKPPQLVARRNARERRRVQSVNVAFARLRRAVPCTSGRSKRVSKVKTLQGAIDYIYHLQELLHHTNNTNCSAFCHLEPSNTCNMLQYNTEISTFSNMSEGRNEVSDPCEGVWWGRAR